MPSFFINKVVLITGGTDGIGKALVKNLIQIGAFVCTCGRNEENLNELKTEISSNKLFVIKADVSNQIECKKFIDESFKIHNRIDILINNAGISMRAEFEELDLKIFESIININFLGAVYCTKFVLPYLKLSKGYIVGISSVAGFKATPGRTAYSASKFALNGFLESLKIELKHHSIKVINIAPGFISSNIRKRALNKNGNTFEELPLNENKMMTPNECALKILKAIKNNKKITVLTILGKTTYFLSKFLPAFSDKLVRNFYYKNNKLIK